MPETQFLCGFCGPEAIWEWLPSPHLMITPEIKKTLRNLSEMGPSIHEARFARLC